MISWIFFFCLGAYVIGAQDPHTRMLLIDTFVYRTRDKTFSQKQRERYSARKQDYSQVWIRWEMPRIYTQRTRYLYIIHMREFAIIGSDDVRCGLGMLWFGKLRLRINIKRFSIRNSKLSAVFPRTCPRTGVKASQRNQIITFNKQEKLETKIISSQKHLKDDNISTQKK